MAARLTPNAIRHGHSRRGLITPTYQSWSNMLRRCGDSRNAKYSQYGGRGIVICEQWLMFDNFLADMGEKPKNMTLERIDVNGNYEPRNCKWASMKEQANNKTNNRLITWLGETKTESQWASHIGISFPALRTRFYRGWPIEKALTQPIRKQS